MKIIKILEKIKKLNITMEKMVIIKLINCLSNLSKIHLIILYQKTRNENIFFNL